MGKFLKKNWFVVLVATLFIGVVGYYIYDTNKGKLKGKKANGEDVVYEINGNDTTASAFYDELYSSWLFKNSSFSPLLSLMPVPTVFVAFSIVLI